MNTLFTVTAHKGTPQEKEYTIDLGQDILDGVHENTVLKLAGQSLVITVQGKLRKKDSAIAIEEMLQKEYPLASVTDGVIREQTINAKLKALEKIIGKDKVVELIAQELEKTALQTQ